MHVSDIQICLILNIFSFRLSTTNLWKGLHCRVYQK